MGSRAYKKENKPFVTGLVVILIVIIAFQQWMIVGYKQAVVGAQEMPPEMPLVGYYPEQPTEEAPTEAPPKEGVILTVPEGGLSANQIEKFQERYGPGGESGETDQVIGTTELTLDLYRTLTIAEKEDFLKKLTEEEKKQFIALIMAKMPPEGGNRIIELLKNTKIGKAGMSAYDFLTVHDGITLLILFDIWAAKGVLVKRIGGMIPYFQFAKDLEVQRMLKIQAILEARAAKRAQNVLDLADNVSLLTRRGYMELAKKASIRHTKQVLKTNGAVQLAAEGVPVGIRELVHTRDIAKGITEIVEDVTTFTVKGGKVIEDTVRVTTRVTPTSRVIQLVKRLKNPKVAIAAVLLTVLGYDILSFEEETLEHYQEDLTLMRAGDL